MFHAIGGATVGGMSLLVALVVGPFWAQFVVGVLLFSYLFWEELKDHERGQRLLKTVVDFCIWASAYLVVATRA
jgi:hypothetical protein